MPAIPTMTPSTSPASRSDAPDLLAELRRAALDYLHDQHADGATVVRIETLNEILMGPAFRPYTVRNRRAES